MSNIDDKILKLQEELQYFLNLPGNSKLKWKYIKDIETELELLKEFELKKDDLHN